MSDHRADPPSSPASRGMLTHALPDLAAWTSHLRNAEIPVLAETSETLEGLRANEDRVDANGLGEVIAADPLMTLKLLAYAARHRPPRLVTETTTVTAALVMMGIPPFFRAFGPQPTIEDWLAAQPAALDGARAVLRRSHRASRFALAFAIHRMDHDAALIHLAALLHDFAELLLWCHAPALALEIREAQIADPTLRSADIQRRVLNVELIDLQHALMQAWRLPELLVRIADDRHADRPNVRSVVLAVRLARHAARGGRDNPALHDDVGDIGALLNLSHDAALAWIGDLLG